MTNSKVEFNTLGGPLRRRSTFSPTHLSTQVAEFTFAQIVDGLPTRHTDQFRILQYSPKIHEREGPNSLARNVVAEWRSKFQAENLVVDPDVAEAYQNTAVGTREFHLRLIEIAAIALHTIASDLFSHTNKPSYKRPQSPRLEFPPGEFIMRPGEKRDIPTYLYPQNYIDHDRYPMGVADMVGYWAEYPVLGDVVLFDRGQSEKEFRDVFFHPRAGFRVFKLSETQVDQFIHFGLYGENSTPCPFPMEAERHALRVDADDTFALHIFRNKYERKPLSLCLGWPGIQEEDWKTIPVRWKF